MLNSDDLRFFCVLAGQPSLAQTARTLNVTPSSITQRLQAIEDKLKLKLLNRQGRTTTLTDEGQLLAERARLILADMDELQESLHDRKNELVGRLRILAPLGFGNEYVAELAAQFQAQHRNVSVELVLSDSPNRQTPEAWDIVIHIGALPDSSMLQTVLAKNRRFLCAAPDYVARCGRPANIADLRHHACISLQENAEDVTMWRLQAPGADAYASIRIRPRLTSNDGRVVKQWALKGHGIMMRSEWDVAQELRSGTLVRILPDHALPGADIVALLGSAQRQRSARTMRFLDLLRQSLGARPWAAREI
ncbi:HTH-type transcriptional regulator DmlR [Massilia sp. Bi118]|uniref:LysR family transcriptional regulator n=1 Tax=Massilia sp. Bi118 TaxID=2822346 RepID=UPI001DDF9AFF|nr:LysR family transcriptional regulator [Massilia sp. Bi118]CAH0276607.1 HTH-type transcriptional regulator DmlR [Massilia sp. Bi118]